MLKKTKIAVINDTHFGVRNGSDLFSNYMGEFFEKEFFPYCEKEGIDTIVHLGDFFDHRKFVNFKTVANARKFFTDHLTRTGMHMYIIPGNHDCYWKNTNELCSLNELLIHDNITVVSEAKVINICGTDIAFLPWICEENYERSMQFVASAPSAILMSHLELAGFKMMSGLSVESHGQDKKLFDRFEMVLSGHYHTKSSQGNVHYLGTQFELTWSDCNDPKYFHILDTSTRELTPIRNPNSIYIKLAWDDSELSDPVEFIKEFDASELKDKFVKIVVVCKKDSYTFERFVDKVTSAQPYDVKIIEGAIDLLDPSNLDSTTENIDDTPTLLNKYVDSMQTDLDKSLIKKRLQRLLTEAQSLEIS
jgi:DNA repair exonuclease SbcCD nuclease subunit